MAHLLFCQLTKPNKKSKRATKPTQQDNSKQWTTEQRQTEGQLVTAVFAKKRVEWLIEHSTSYQHLWFIDSLVLRNPLLRKAANR